MHNTDNRSRSTCSMPQIAKGQFTPSFSVTTSARVTLSYICALHTNRTHSMMLPLMVDDWCKLGLSKTTFADLLAGGGINVVLY